MQLKTDYWVEYVQLLFLNCSSQTSLSACLRAFSQPTSHYNLGLGSHSTPLRLQMSVHRLLQRAFARMYKYVLPQPGQKSDCQSILGLALQSHTEYEAATMSSHSMADLHFKLKGARY